MLLPMIWKLYTWNSITWIWVIGIPNIWLTFISFIIRLSLILKTDVDLVFDSRSSSLVISYHFGLQVNVINKSGFPFFLTIDMASWYFWVMSLSPPLKLEGKITILPKLSTISNCLSFTKSTNPLYKSARNYFWLSLMNFKLLPNLQIKMLSVWLYIDLKIIYYLGLWCKHRLNIDEIIYQIYVER